jgi:hypothetical protein
MGGLQAIQLNSCKNFKNRVQRIVNKRQIEFMKDEVISHIVTTTSSEWQVIEIARQNTDIARVANPRKVLNCQSFLLWILPSCILFWGHISSFNKTCLFIISLLFWKHEMFISMCILTKKIYRTPTCKIKANQS